MNKVLIVDGNSLINRAYFALPPLTSKKGVPTNAAYGFINMMIKLIDKEKPEYVCVCFDLKGPTFRHEEYKEYKGHRKGMDEELRVQFPVIKSFLNALGIQIAEMPGFEADDLIGTLADNFSRNSCEAVIVTGDKDALQLASDSVSIMLTRRGISKLDVYDPHKVFEEYGLSPGQIPDYKGLCGDASDNIKGLPGIGDKTAIKLLKEFESVENLIENSEKIENKRIRKIVEENADTAVLSKRLATIVVDVPLEFDYDEFKLRGQKTDELLELIDEYDLKTLLKHVKIGDESTIGVTEESDLTGLNLTNTIQIDICDLNASRFMEESLKKISGMKSAGIKIVYEKKDLRTDRIIGVGCSGCDEETKERTDYYFNMKIEENGLMSSYENGIDFLKKLFSIDTVFAGFDIKSEILALFINDLQIPVNIFDVKIAQYLIDPDRSNYSLKDISGENKTGFYTMSEEELLGKGVKKTSYSECEVNRLIEFAVTRSRASDLLMKSLSEKLKENELETLFYDVEMPLIEVLASIEYHGFSVDETILCKLGDEIGLVLDSLTSRIYDACGEEFNINSPKQLGEILFERMGLPAKKKTKTGYSTNAEVLEKLRHAHPVIELIMEYRTYSKLKSTYIDGLKNVINVKTGKIHTSLNQTIAGTGRLSSSDPNLQNIPVRLEFGRNLRKIFISSGDNILVDADYSQIELRILAQLSGDITMKNSFRESKDIHAITASQVFGIPPEEVSSYERGSAKAVNFGIVYGMSDFGLSETLGISVGQAKNYIKGYFKTYPSIKEFLDQSIENCRNDGYVKTILGRKRFIKDIKNSNYNIRSYAERAAMNTPIQGSAADIMKLAMLRAYRGLKGKGLKSKLILQVHDELIVDAYPEEVDAVKYILRESMENALEGFVQFEVPLLCSMSCAGSWYEAK